MWFGRKEATKSNVAIYRIYFTYAHICTYKERYIYIQTQNIRRTVVVMPLKDKIILAFPLPSTALLTHSNTLPVILPSI